jgi:asparagine synthase (glutamine-hydrolysing)
MCGIAGFSGDFERALLDRMNAVQSHRGPDDSGTVYLERDAIGLAHRRLSIIDLSPAGHQPMEGPGGDWIVYNGEIYNYRELRAELASQGVELRSQSDTEVLLHLYRRDGVEMLAKLNGMFAFALWDARERRLFLARDGMGVKPLYWAETPRGFLFASELKTLLLEPSLDRTLDARAIQQHLAFLWSTAPRTLLRSVRKLEPGWALLVRSGRIERRWQHYDLPYRSEPQRISVADAAALVRQAIATAVERQMVADVPVGTFLSGGLDSSAVTAFAAQRTSGRRLSCFTIGFGEESFGVEGLSDDLPYARRVASHLDVDLHVIDVGPEMVDELEAMVWHLDEPTADPAPLNALFISALARRHGIKVLLSGAGGDDLFSGYRRHLALLGERSWGWLPRPARAGVAALARGLSTSRPLGRRVRKALAYADLDADERLASYFRWIEPEVLRSLYGPAIRSELEQVADIEPLLATQHRLPAGVHPLNRMLYLEAKHFLADHNLNYGDKMSMAVGVEARVPLLDPDVVALATSLPVEFKQRGAVGKWIFKKAMEPLLPRDVIYRPKSPFGAPLRTWLRGRLRPWLEECLSEPVLRRRGLFDPAAASELMRADRTGRIDGSYTLFAMLCVELWCRMFLDGKPRATALLRSA